MFGLFVGYVELLNYEFMLKIFAEKFPYDI